VEFKDRVYITNEMKHFFNELKIPAVYVEMYTNSISIIVQKIEEIDNTRKSVIDNKGLVLEKVEQLMLQTGNGEQFYSYDWYVNHVYSRDATYITNLIRKSKEEIIEEIKKTREINTKPSHIFSFSSSYENGNYPAGYNLVFDNKDLLERSVGESRCKLVEICRKIVFMNDKERKFNNEYMIVKFLGATNCNMYGIARED